MDNRPLAFENIPEWLMEDGSPVSGWAPPLGATGANDGCESILLFEFEASPIIESH
jgi:hypothetical protein